MNKNTDSKFIVGSDPEDIILIIGPDEANTTITDEDLNLFENNYLFVNEETVIDRQPGNKRTI